MTLFHHFSALAQAKAWRQHNGGSSRRSSGGGGSGGREKKSSTSSLMDEAVVGRKVDSTIHLGEGIEPCGSLLDEREQRLKGLGDGGSSGSGSSDGSMIITNVAQEVEDQLLNARRPMTKNDDDNQFQKQQAFSKLRAEKELTSTCERRGSDRQ